MLFYEKKEFIQEFINIMYKCNEIILNVYNDENMKVCYKDDDSPLTVADKKCNDYICECLQKINNKLFSNNVISKNNIVIISEEIKNDDYSDRKNKEWCWLVDPLDGTKEFVKRNGQFTVNIGLTQHGIPVFGFVSIPVSNDIYYGIKNVGSFKITNNVTTPLKVKQNKDFSKKHLRIIASSSHMNKETKNYINNFNEPIIKSTGSSIKLLWIAENKADVYPRIAPTCEWDTCAAHAVVKYAGGNVQSYSTQKELVYNKQNLLNPYFITY